MASDHDVKMASDELRDLLSADSGLTDWEIEFIEDMNTNRHLAWTPKQIAKIHQIWDKLFG